MRVGGRLRRPVGISYLRFRAVSSPSDFTAALTVQHPEQAAGPAGSQHLLAMRRPHNYGLFIVAAPTCVALTLKRAGGIASWCG